MFRARAGNKGRADGFAGVVLGAHLCAHRTHRAPAATEMKYGPGAIDNEEEVGEAQSIMTQQQRRAKRVNARLRDMGTRIEETLS